MKEQSIYLQMMEAEVPIDAHESDLYVKVTPASTAILEKWEFRDHVTMFRSSIAPHDMWYDVPGQYEPFWVSRMILVHGRDLAREIMSKEPAYSRPNQVPTGPWQPRRRG